MLVDGDDKQAAKTLTDLVYIQIREDILSGALEPGSRLRVEPLKQRYGMGASPIREALTRLSGDGLVDMEGRRGFTVAEISLSELTDITETRAMIETETLRCSIEMAAASGEGDRWEAGVVASFHRLSKLDAQVAAEGPTPEWEVRHREFHEALVAACPYGRLQHFRRNLFDQSERYRRLSMVSHAVERDVPGEHRGVMEAALAYDAEKACSLLAQHIRKTGAIVAVAVGGPAGATVGRAEVE